MEPIETTYETAKAEMSSAYGKIYAAVLDEKNAEIVRLQRRVTELEETLREMA